MEVISPCINVCTYDEKRICLGCKRSEDEIIDWDIKSSHEKKKIIENTLKRRSEHVDYYGDPLM